MHIKYLQTYHRKKDPYQQIYIWAKYNPLLADSIKLGKQLSSEQQLAVSQYMVNDQYFSDLLIKELKGSKNNFWINNLPPSAQQRYLKILAGLETSDFLQSKRSEKVQQKIKGDYDIWPEYEKYTKLNPLQDPIRSAYQIICNNYI